MLTDDPTNPGLKETRPDGQNKVYLVLSEEERKLGFVRPLRRSYVHAGIRPKYPLRNLTADEHERYDQYGYVKYEEYPKEESPVCGKFWTLPDLKSGCGTTTTMGLVICETYARRPGFYGSTFCCHCGKHLPVGEFVWSEDGAVLGS